MSIQRLSRTNKFVLLLLPLTTAILAIFSKIATGPYWLGGNSDPAYLYLINSLYLADGHTPFFVDHPGTTLQVLGAIIIKICNIGVSREQIAGRVLTNPEEYLHTLYYTLLSLYIISLIIVGFYAFKKTRNIVFSLYVQTSSLLFLTCKSYISGSYVLPVIANVNSDTLILPITNFIIICLLKYYGDFHLQKKHYLTASLFGIACGLGVATKLTFLPILLLPLILLPKLKEKGLFFLVTLGTFAASISPILFSRFDEISGWVVPIITGANSAANIRAYSNGFFQLIKSHSLLFLTTIASLIVSINNFLLSGKGSPLAKKEDKFLFAIAVTCLFQFLFIAKRQAPHYMSPAAGLLGLLLGFLFLSINWKNTKKAAAICLLLVISSLIVFSFRYQQKLYKTNKDIAGFSKRIHEQYDACVIFGYYRSSSIPTAIEFAHAHGNQKIYSKLLIEKYPNSYFYNIFQHTFHNFDKNIMLKDLLKKRDFDCALLYGSERKFEDFLEIEESESMQNEKLYKIKSTTLDDAHMSYLISKQLEAKKKYKAALLYALRAKHLGRPALDVYIDDLKQLISLEK